MLSNSCGHPHATFIILDVKCRFTCGESKLHENKVNEKSIMASIIVYFTHFLETLTLLLTTMLLILITIMILPNGVSYLSILRKCRWAFWLMSGLKVKLDESKVRKETIPKRLNQKLQGIYLYTAFSIDDYM